MPIDEEIESQPDEEADNRRSQKTEIRMSKELGNHQGKESVANQTKQHQADRRDWSESDPKSHLRFRNDRSTEVADAVVRGKRCQAVVAGQGISLSYEESHGLSGRSRRVTAGNRLKP